MMTVARLCLFPFFASAVMGFKPTQDPNMNGEYLLSKTPKAPEGVSFSTDFKDFPGGVEYFEVYYGPITSLYSEVYWTSHTNDLPDEIVKRFDGKVMAIVGLEMDQVRRTPAGDVSVPINVAYNHHHDTAIVGKSTTLKKVKFDGSNPRMAEAASTRNFVRLDKGYVWLPVEHTPTKSGRASSAMFSAGNGGEYRKSWHGLAPPFAQLVESPQTLSGSAMQIDTWNRDKMNLTGSPFVSGPVPRATLAPLSGVDATYSGLLECPITTRIQKIVDGGNAGFDDTYQVGIFSCDGSSPHSCEHSITKDKCFTGALEVLGPNATVSTKSSSSDVLPPGCTVSFDASAKSFQVFFNTNDASQACCGAGLDETIGATASLVTLGLTVSRSNSQVTITMSGPAEQWFGVGFNASSMTDTPYAIVVEGGSGDVSERRLVDQQPGTLLNSSVTVISNTVSSGVRSVVMTRALTGATLQHYTFDSSALSIDFINAVGYTPTFSYHKSKTAATINLWPSGQEPACVCSEPPLPFGDAGGKIKYLPTGEIIGFQNKCDPQPRTDLLAQKNPTCDLRAYSGGLNVCHNGWMLLDADQEIPWQDQPLEYYKKFRVYFQEYNASFHKQIIRSDWGIGADSDHAEYDVPQCAPGTPTAECTHEITGTWTPVASSSPDIHLVSAAFHCHAPTCLKVEVWNNDTGELICRQEPVYGTDKIDDDSFDEAGYIATPPCIWGSPEHGLEPPPLVSGVRVQVIATTNNTYGHHGEMALPEMCLVKM